MQKYLDKQIDFNEGVSVNERVIPSFYFDSCSYLWYNCMW